MNAPDEDNTGVARAGALGQISLYAGDSRKDLVLHGQRVAAIRTYPVRQRIDAGRLSTRGYGGRQPVAPNDSEAHKARNRRVEFVIVSR